MCTRAFTKFYSCIHEKLRSSQLHVSVFKHFVDFVDSNMILIQLSGTSPATVSTVSSASSIPPGTYWSISLDTVITYLFVLGGIYDFAYM